MTMPRIHEHNPETHPNEHELVDLPELDDGTMSVTPPSPRVDPGPEVPDVPRWWGPFVAAAAGAGLALSLLLLPGAPSTEAPSALAVLTAQQVALETGESQDVARAMDLGAAYLEHGPNGPYRDLIAEGQVALAAER